LVWFEQEWRMRRADGDESTVGVRRRQEAREMIEVLRMRAHLLAGEDRDLVEMYLERGNSLCQIARLMGVSHQNIGRRIRSLVRRITDDTYEICLGNRDDFNGRELGIIRDFFIAGLSCPCITRNRGVTHYHVDATLRKARRYAMSVKGGNA
jgi:predicted DNA-binding protein YlxM (UPF0122 family)